MPTGEITRLLASLRDGRKDAIHDLLPLVYQELHAMARARLRRGAAPVTLATTDLVHEAYLKLFERSDLSVVDRRHFMAVAAMAIRQIVVDRARRRAARKRGGERRRIDLDAAEIPVEDHAEDLLSLDEALSRLNEVDERLARVVELRFYAGLSVEETAEVLEVDARTVKRDWRKARALLLESLGGAGTP